MGQQYSSGLGRSAHVRPETADAITVTVSETSPSGFDCSVERRSIVCPSCSMEASASDRRLLQPMQVSDDLRRCRNCRAVIDLSTQLPLIAEPLASV